MPAASALRPTNPNKMNGMGAIGWSFRGLARMLLKYWQNKKQL
jgi:hypothetical protein